MGDVQNLRVLAVLFGDPQAHVGGAGHHQRIGVRGACGQQGRQGVRGQVVVMGDLWGLAKLRQLLEQFGLIHLRARQVGHALRGVENRAVTGAAAQVAGELFHRQFAADGAALADMVLVHAEHAHHKTRRAETALRTVAVDHGLLRGMQIGVRSIARGGRRGGLNQRILCQIFHRPQRHAVDRVGQANAAVDRLVVQFAIALLSEHDGAGAAVAFAAAFLGAGAVQVFTQHVQQGTVGRNAVEGHGLAATDKAQGAGVAHKNRNACLVSERCHKGKCGKAR